MWKSSTEEDVALNCFLNRFDEMEEEMTAIPGRGDVRAKV